MIEDNMGIDEIKENVDCRLKGIRDQENYGVNTEIGDPKCGSTESRIWDVF